MDIITLITPFLSFVSLLFSCNGNNRCCYLCDLQENKDVLDTAMEELKNARVDVKRRVDEAENNPNEHMKCIQEVKGWLQLVQTIEGDVVKVIQEAGQETEGRCFGGYCPKNFWTTYKIGKLVIQKLAIVNDLKSKGSFVDVAYRLPPPLVQEAPEDLTVGMESMLDEVWKSIAKDGVRIMGLYGQGGVGKTTLLKLINNKFLKDDTTHGFDVVILVVVSKEIKIDAIQKEIGNRLGLSSPDKISIFNALTKKKFVLLLDDIWERVDLQSVGIPCPENSKSKVLFTTRFEYVCGDMDANKNFKVECLPNTEAWTLFQKKVGNEILNVHPEVPELAHLVAKECGGLPLALITIGRAMSTKKSLQEWKHAIATLRKSASKFPGMGDKVLPLLKLSYDDLQNETIKSCFLYCALYPEDWSIDKAKLIDYWIGEGFISLNEFDHIDEARNHGYDVIGILKGACLLESGRDEETQVKMHDTIRDLALWITCECNRSNSEKMLIIEESDRMSERWYNAERIWLRSRARGEIEVYVPPPNSPVLLTLIYDPSFSGLFDLFLPNNFFEFMPHLRVLDLSHSDMCSFPTSITGLFDLQYLSLSWTHVEEIPEDLGKLVKLNYLDLSHMMYLKKIPNGVIGNLLELRVLNLYGCSGDWNIEEVYKLKHLNDLRISINTQPTLNKLLSLGNQNLQMCTRHLHLRMYNTDSMPSFPVCITDSMFSPSPTRCIPDLDSTSMCITDSSPVCITELSPIFTRYSLPMCITDSSPVCIIDSSVFSSFLPSSSSALEVDNTVKSLKNLELLSNLEILLIQSLRMNMEWENHHEAQQQLRSFQNLSEITISECYGLKDLTWVVYVGNLKKLDVDSCEGIEEIIVGDKISGIMIVDVFKSLKTLKMTHLRTLKSICSQALVFPSLVSMYVFKCPQLKKLPLDSSSNANNTLQVIEGQRTWWSELEWEDHDNVKSKFDPYIKHRHFND